MVNQVVYFLEDWEMARMLRMYEELLDEGKISPELAWKMIRPILLIYRSKAKSKNYKIVELKDGTVILKNDTGLVHKRRMWYDRYIYGNEIIPRETPPELYLCKQSTI